MREINEWTFASDTCKTIQSILADNPELPFTEAKVEEGASRGRKRRDLTLYHKESEPVLTGEIKLPDRPDGQSPYADPLLEDAFQKANAKGVEYFFTWNVNRFVLWKTFEARKPIAERDLEHFNVTSILNSDELTTPGVQAEIRGFLTQFLGRFARILEGTEPIRSKPLDEKFIRVLESALELPILQTRNALAERYSAEPRFARKLDAWMRDSQGWLISNDPGIQKDNRDRAAKFSCYVLVNKIIFQQALRRRFRLRKIRIPESVGTTSKLQETFKAAFEEAKRVSHDYETVFDGDFGDSLPFLDDSVVHSWREFLREIEGFDFSKIEYDIIGHIFERLISPEERHRYGQHYTRSEVVDLINSFSIRKPDAVVLDPACGGGTFLVRSYVLKRDLSQGRLSHEDLLQQIKGLDISAYAAHLATVNLATRDLIDEKNYPLVARSDFFRVKTGEPVFHVPMSVHGKGKQMMPLEIGQLDSVVGNPPYVRQEALPREYKTLLSDVLKQEFPEAHFSGRSDLHCYFWPHATTFLRNNGHFGFLTSSGWLDVEYGFRLQEWLLRHFSILALFESNCETWFTGARVNTVATLLRRESDSHRRASNTVRFVQLRKPLKEVLESFDPDPIVAARTFRDFVEGQEQSVLDDRWRIRVVNQLDLWNVGCSGGVAGGISSRKNTPRQSQDDLTTNPDLFQGEYQGGKWGIYLRAPNIFFALLDRFGPHFVPLSQLAQIRYGVKTGADDFFFVRDVTDDELDKHSKGFSAGDPEILRRFRDKWGITPQDTNQIRVVQAGDGSRHLVEADYLEPEVHSLMEIESVEIDPKRLGRKIILVSDPRDLLTGTHILEYIGWGEREGFDQTATCAARAKTRPWYDVTVEKRSPILWPKAHQYRHIVPINEKALIPNCRMYDLFLEPEMDIEVLAGVLNSTVVALTKFLFGRPVGREGSLDTEVVDVNMMLVPDIREVSQRVSEKIRAAFQEMRVRPARPLLEELSFSDRQALDDATLELLGLNDPTERRELRDSLYSQIDALYKEIREVELIKQGERRATSHRDRASPRIIAQEIWKEMDASDLPTSPIEFLTNGELLDLVRLPSGKPQVIDDLFQSGTVRVEDRVLKMGSRPRAEFAAKLMELGLYGEVGIPRSDRACQRALESFSRHERRMEQRFRELAEERSADSEAQARIVRELWKLFRAAVRHSELPLN
jgi:methylase of polypeptide subunit release factors